jgi:probable DNA metabolism protein
MEPSTLFYYDESFEGFLTACSNALVQREGLVELRKPANGPDGLFQNERRVPTDRNRARELWDAMGQKGTAHQRLVYFSFLSEQPGVEKVLLAFIRQVLQPIPDKGTLGFGDPPAVLLRWAGQVAAERRRVEASLNFQNPEEGLFTGLICPEYNVLPLLSRQFRNRFRSDSWLVFDYRRNWALWGREGSSLFLERLADCPADVRSLVRKMHPSTDRALETGLQLPVRAASFPRDRKAEDSLYDGLPQRAYQQAV